jgi:hypothetical protein
MLPDEATTETPILKVRLNDPAAVDALWDSVFAAACPEELDGLLPRPEQVKPHNDVLIRVRVISDTGKAYKVALATLATGVGSTWLPRRWRVPGSTVEEFRIPAWAWTQKRADLLGPEVTK